MSEVLIGGSNTTMECARRSTKQPVRQNQTWEVDQPRWKTLLDVNDNKIIRKSINWKGNLQFENKETPSDEQFKEHFENLLNSSDEESKQSDAINNDDSGNMPYIIILDDAFSEIELNQAIRDLNKNKSYVGMCPALRNVLDVTWGLFILTILNAVFNRVYYPTACCYNKLIILFKSGRNKMCNNYRGISVMDTLAKLYDIVILSRIKLWWNIDKFQAGAQNIRGCVQPS